MKALTDDRVFAILQHPDSHNNRFCIRMRTWSSGRRSQDVARYWLNPFSEPSQLCVEGHRSLGQGSANGVSRGRGLQPVQSQIHAVVRRGLDRGANCAAACCTIALGHHMVLLDRLKEQPTREWYVKAAVEHGRSRNVLVHHISTQLQERQGSAHQFLPHPAPRRFGPGGTDPKRPLQLRLSHPSPNSQGEGTGAGFAHSPA